MPQSNTIQITGDGNIIVQDANGANITIHAQDAHDIVSKLNQLNAAQLDALSQIVEKENEKLGNLFKTLLNGVASQKNIVKGNISNVQTVRIGDEIHYHYSASTENQITSAKPSEKYIPPSLKLFNNLEDLINHSPTSFHRLTEEYKYKIIDIEDLLVSRAFIIAEPGYGKSELLNQVRELGKSLNKNIEIYRLKDLENEPNKIQFRDEEIICFDALDEVTYGSRLSIVNNLRVFCKKNPQKSILISCRKHDAQSHKTDFFDYPGFQFIDIEHFSTTDISDFLKRHGIEDDLTIRAIIEKSNTQRDEIPILSIPRYLNALSKVIISGKASIEDIKRWKRIDFFDRFIYEKLENAINIESAKQNELYITKRVLEKLALVMEIYQTNTITKDEIISFLDGVKSNINLVFLNTCNIDTFIERVLQPKDDNLEFHNTEFQEYLAAKELDRIASNPQVIYDLTVQSQFNKIYSNWYDVLKYLVEINPSHILPFVELLDHKRNSWIEVSFWGLMNSIDPQLLSSKDRGYIFKVLFTYFQEVPETYIIQYFDIALFYESENYNLIKLLRTDIGANDKETTRKLYNKIDILTGIVEKLNNTQKNECKNDLSVLIKQTDNPNFQSILLRGIAFFGDAQLLEDILYVFEGGNKEVQESFAYACKTIIPNTEFACNVYIYLLRKVQSNNAVTGINELVYPDLIILILQCLCDDDQLLANYIPVSNMYYSSTDYGLLATIQSNWNERIENLLLQILYKILLNEVILPYHEEENFAKRLISVLGKANPSLSLTIVSDIEDFHMLMIRYGSTFADVLLSNQVEEFISIAIEKDEYAMFYMMRYVLSRLFGAEDGQKKEVFDSAFEIIISREPKLSNFFSIELNESIKRQEEENRKNIVYKHFQKLLNPSPGKFKTGVFRYYLDNKNVIREKATEEELNLLISYLQKILPKISPAKTEVLITFKDSNTQSYRMNHDVMFYSEYLEMAEDLKIDSLIELSRKNLIEYLPLIHINNSNDIDKNTIIKRLGSISPEEEDYFIKIISNRDDDYMYHSPSSFAKIVKHFKLHKLLGFLKDQINNDKIRDYERIQIFHEISEFELEAPYLQFVFDKYEMLPNEYKLKELAIFANDQLIRRYRDVTAIEWRFEHIKSLERLYKDERDRAKGVIWGYPDWEYEMDHQLLARPLIEIVEPNLIPKFQELLTKALSLRKENEYYRYYSDYLLKIVKDFYLAIKVKETYSVLKDLHLYLDLNHKKEKGYFSKYLSEIEMAYIEVFDKPASIQQCINKYNDIRDNIYLPIYSTKDLYHLILEAIQTDIKNFVRNEGFYKVLEDYYYQHSSNKKKKMKFAIHEDYIQKTIKVQLENALLSKGIRKTDFIREAQLQDDKRIDLIVKYGFFPPVVIELKLLHNPEISNDIERQNYKSKLDQYLQSQNAQFGIYLIFKVKKGKDDKFIKLREEYNDLKGWMIPDYIDCTL